MPFGWFKEIAMTVCLILPCTMLSAAHAGEHMAETRASMAQENVNPITAASVNAETIKQLAFNSAETMTPIKMVHLEPDLVMAFTTMQMSILNMQIVALKEKIQEDESAILMNQADTSELNKQIQLANAQLNEVLSDMNASITAAANVLANISNLSAETLGQLHGAAE
jgi:hypothetical protein